MSQTPTQTPEGSAKNLANAFFAVANEIDEARRPAAILTGISLIAAAAKPLSRQAEAASAREPKVAKARRMKKAGAKAAKPATNAAADGAAADGAAVEGASPADAVIAVARGPRPTKKIKPPMRRAAAVEAGNGASAAA